MAKILVVDDDARNLRLAVAALEQAGHEVLSAEGGAAGIEAALAHAPDLILMDVQMPGMDGIAALKRLRADPRTAAAQGGRAHRAGDEGRRRAAARRGLRRLSREADPLQGVSGERRCAAGGEERMRRAFLLCLTLAAAITGMTQPKVSQVGRYKLQNISLERLMQALVSFDQQVEITVKPARRAHVAGITVAA